MPSDCSRVGTVFPPVMSASNSHMMDWQSARGHVSSTTHSSDVMFSSCLRTVCVDTAAYAPQSGAMSLRGRTLEEETGGSVDMRTS